MPRGTIAEELHDAAADPKILGAAGLLVGGGSPIAGLALGLKAAHEEEAAGQPTSLVTKLAIGRGAFGLVAGAIGLIIFLSIMFTMLGHSNGVGPGIVNPYNTLNCQSTPKPSIPGVTHWTCTNGVWIGN
jgi:hypothetical protein